MWDAFSTLLLARCARRSLAYSTLRHGRVARQHSRLPFRVFFCFALSRETLAAADHIHGV
jgi:hypothetical protein